MSYKKSLPGQNLRRLLEAGPSALASAGVRSGVREQRRTIAVIGVYPERMVWFPFGQAMNKNLTVQAGNCNHRRYIPNSSACRSREKAQSVLRLLAGIAVLLFWARSWFDRCSRKRT